MRIAIFTDTYAPQVNGVAKTLARLTDYLDNHGVEYLVFAPENVGSDQTMDHVAKIRSIPLSIYPECRLAMPGTRAIREKIMHFQPDFIHVATPFTMGLIGKYYARKLDVPVVGSYHTDFDAYLSYYKMEWLSPVFWNYLRWFHNSLQKTFVPSTETLRQVQAKGFQHLSIWSRGVDCQLFHPVENRLKLREKYGIRQKYSLVFAGRLAPEKDLETLLEVMRRVNQMKQAEVCWLIAGDGPMAAELKEKAPHNSVFTGYLEPSQLADVYAASDLMVFPSPTETFGNVVLESMACGTPVVGADAGGVRTIIADQQNGRLCPPKQAGFFADAVLALLENHRQRAAFARAARGYALTQSWEAIFSQLLADYDAVLQNDEGAAFTG